MNTSNESYVKDKRALTVRGRIELLCEWFELSPPEIRYEEGAEGCDRAILMTDELLEWARASRVSINWLLAGDAKGLCELMRTISLMSDKNAEAA